MCVCVCLVVVMMGGKGAAANFLEQIKILAQNQGKKRRQKMNENVLICILFFFVDLVVAYAKKLLFELPDWFENRKEICLLTCLVKYEFLLVSVQFQFDTHTHR